MNWGIKKLHFLIIIFFFYLLQGCKENQKNYADTIYLNGTMLTMNDVLREVEAVAVGEGKIIALGAASDVLKYQDNNTVIKDLKGRTLLPGFIDAHSHITMAMKTINWADLNAPPVGNVTSINSLLEAIKSNRDNQNVQPGEWLLGWGYDPDQLEERRHPNRKELSLAFPDNPVFLLHVSAHMGVVNNAALELANISVETPDPSGGLILREQNSKVPNGLLQEKAMYLVLPLLPEPGPSELVQLFEKTQHYYASYGITTAQDGLTDFKTYGFLQEMAKQEQLKIDVESLASFIDAESFFNTYEFGISSNGLRLAGVKVVSDGSPQGKTAFFREPYLTEVPGCVHDCRGFPTIQNKDLQDLMSHCYKNDIQLYVHANGDASIELLLDIHDEVTEELEVEKSGQRTVVIHSQFAGKDQLARYREYEFIPSFFSNHAFFWGEVHLTNLGRERASFLSPLKTATDMGIVATNHTDFTITPINQMFLLWTAVNRLTRSGTVLGADERISAWEGLKAITINSAIQHRTESLKGSLEIGKIADFVILDKNPLTEPAINIKDIQVVETIKEDQVIYRRDLH